MAHSENKPFLPSERRRSTISPVVKMATAHLLAFNENNFLDDVIEREYGRDSEVRDFRTRAASTISSQSTMTAFSQVGAPEYMGGLAASSSGLTLLASEGGLQLSFDGNATIDVASVIAAASGAGYVPEGGVLPVRQYAVSNAVLTPKKFAGISALTREIFKYSRPAIEQIVRAAMSNDIALQFDTALLDSNAETSTRPAGLRAGISANATGASTATALAEATTSDIETIIAAVSAVANNGPIAIVASTRQAVALRLRQQSNFQYSIYSTSGLEDGAVAAVATNCLISAIDPTPRFEVSDQGTLHLDTSPSPFSSVASPNTVAAKQINLFQSDMLALRVVFEVSYALRSPLGLSWLGNVKW